MNASSNEKVVRVMNGVAAGTTAQTSSAIDTRGWDGVKIYTAFGAITSGAVTSVKLQQSSDDASADAYADLTGTSISVADDDDNQVTVQDLYRPLEPYIKVVISRATQNAVIDGVFAVLYNGREAPSTDDTTTVVGREIYASPAEGTA